MKLILVLLWDPGDPDTSTVNSTRDKATLHKYRHLVVLPAVTIVKPVAVESVLKSHFSDHVDSMVAWVKDAAEQTLQFLLDPVLCDQTMFKGFAKGHRVKKLKYDFKNLKEKEREPTSSTRTIANRALRPKTARKSKVTGKASRRSVQPEVEVIDEADDAGIGISEALDVAASQEAGGNKGATAYDLSAGYQSTLSKVICAFCVLLCVFYVSHFIIIVISLLLCVLHQS